MNLKKNKKKYKKRLISAWGHVDVTWHSGPRGNATRAHAAPTRHISIHIIYLFTIYIKGLQPSLYGKGY